MGLSSTFCISRSIQARRGRLILLRREIPDMGDIRQACSISAATDDGTIDGKPVFLSEAQWEKEKKESSIETIATQMLLNPSAGTQQELKPEWLRPYELRPETLNVYIMGDYAGSRKSTGSSNTAIVVIGVDTALNKYLLDGVCHKMSLDERWEKLRDFRKKWLRQKGIQIVEVGYERFGAQSDIEHFETMMKIEGEAFNIKELAWPREGSVSKDNRIRRLIPDLKNWRFFVPHNSHVPTKAQVRAKNEGQAHWIAQPIKQKNHEGRPYDVVEWFIRNEYLFFPNTTKKDFLDATSRIYDMSINPPMIIDERDLYPEGEVDDFDPEM